VLQTNVSVALGNVALADHGRTVAKEELPAPSDLKRYRPLLPGTRIAPLTAQGHVVRPGVGEPKLVDGSAAAVAAFEWSLDSVLPAIEIINSRDDSRWLPRNDLIESGRFDCVFVVETEADGRAYLRFGDDLNGQAVREDDALVARYRIGNGQAGNVGANSIRHLVDAPDGIEAIRNPMAARGGLDPQSMVQAKLYAPQAFRQQERAVTLEDYARAAERHPQVQRAVATRRWTGSWHTVFLTVDRRGGAEVDEDFEEQLRAFLERYRLAGHDLEIDGPRFVSLDLSFEVCAQPGQFSEDVEQRLLRAFSRDVLPDGSRGFFHPDRFTFATPVYLSEMIARAMSVPGVDFISPRKFQRWARTPAGELESGVIRSGKLEIPRLDNDANAPEHGRIDFRVHTPSGARLS
jgi:predicted phage baseplate assembly protein